MHWLKGIRLALVYFLQIFVMSNAIYYHDVFTPEGTIGLQSIRLSVR